MIRPMPIRVPNDKSHERKHVKRRRRIEELQRRRAQINAFLAEDAEDMVSHGWAIPDHREYFTELEKIRAELQQLGAE